MTRIFIVYSFLFLWTFNCFAQTETAIIKFEKTTHDFGTVKEEGSITYEFKFTNTGTVPLVISNVRASCGCTTPGWTKEAILPGKTGVVTAQYNTVNRPGAFNKNLTVTANTEPAMTMLYITGNVTPKVKTPEELYPKKMGNVRLFSDNVYLGKITTKEPFTKDIIIYNEGSSPITLSVTNLPKHITLPFTSQTIAPKDKATIKITYNAKMKNDFGPVDDDIVLTTDEATENKKVLHILADINEYYAPLSGEEAANAPKISLSTAVHDFGTIKVNGTYQAEIEITNNGKQELLIKKVRSGASYIIVKVDKTTIKPGNTVKLKISYKADGKLGADTQMIYIHSSDPLMPTQNFTMKANVIQ
jgi:hypothetical protein